MSLPSNYSQKLWLAILHEVDKAGGSIRPRDLYPRLRSYFPSITDDDLTQTISSGSNKWTNRVQWARQHLATRGCLDKSSHGVWRLTPAGKQWLDQYWRGPDADYSKVPRPAVLSTVAEGKQSKRAPTGSTSLLVLSDANDRETLSGPMLVLEPVEELCQRLKASQRRSGSHQDYEKDLKDAFQFLGFEAQHIGGSGETDIVIRASLGPASYSAVIDAKSTQSGKVSDAQINWLAIDNHRQERGATFAAVVGEDFSGGQLQRFAGQYKVTLITTAMVCELLTLHHSVPLSLVELKELFSASGLADSGMQALRERRKQHLRHWRLVADIIDTIERFETKMPGGFAPTADILRVLLTSQILNSGQSPADVPTLQDVSDAVAFLACRAVGILGEMPDSGGAYQLAMNATTARKRLAALSRFLSSPAPTVSSTTAAAPATLVGAEFSSN